MHYFLTGLLNKTCLVFCQIWSNFKFLYKTKPNLAWSPKQFLSSYGLEFCCLLWMSFIYINALWNVTFSALSHAISFTYLWHFARNNFILRAGEHHTHQLKSMWFWKCQSFGMFLFIVEFCFFALMLVFVCFGFVLNDWILVFGRSKGSPISLTSALGIIERLSLYLEQQSTLQLLISGPLVVFSRSYFLDRYIICSYTSFQPHYFYAIRYAWWPKGKTNSLRYVLW